MACKLLSNNIQTYTTAIKNTIPAFMTKDKTTKKFVKPPKNNCMQPLIQRITQQNSLKPNAKTTNKNMAHMIQQNKH